MIAHVMSGVAVPCDTAVRKSCAAMSAAEPPPIPLKSATICGIAVMRTSRAETAPTTRADDDRRDDQRPVAGVVDERGGDAEDEQHADCGNAVSRSRRRRGAQQLDAEHEADRGQHVAEGGERGRLHVGSVCPESSAASRPSCFSARRAPPEHLQHAVGDDPSADDVERAEQHGRDGDDVAERVVRRCRDGERADEHDAVDEVRSRHQRRVQHRRHFGDEQESDEDREREDEDAERERLTAGLTRSLPAAAPRSARPSACLRA